MALGYLLDPFIQINNVNGTPIVGAKIYVYNADTTNLATTYNDFAGHLNTNPVITDDLGNATIIADDGIEYDISVHDENDLLLFTKKYISIDKTSSAGGNTQVVAGYGVTVNRIGNIFTVSVDTDLIATQDDLADKQDKLQAGANIEITNDNTINVVQRKEFVVQSPLKVDRLTDRIKLYLDSDYANEFKTKQTPVEYGGASGQYISYITQNTNGDIEATVSETEFPTFDNIHAGANIGITRNGNDLTISGKDWSNEINSKISKVTGGAGSETNPVYLDSDNVIQPCFSGSVKLANTIPSYFSADAGSNIMLYAPNGSHKSSGDSIRNSIFITNFDNYLTNSTTDKYEDCIFMGNCYMYSPANAGNCLYEDNIIIGNNSISNAQNYTMYNTVIGTQNDLIGSRGATSHKFEETTVVGYQNNSFTDTRATTIVGAHNDVGNPYGDTQINNKEVQVSIFGYDNEYTYDTTNASTSPSYGLIVGNLNTVFAKDNYKAVAIGCDNSLTGNCTYLIGDSLSANNEGSYEDKVMKVGFGSCHLEIHSTGIIYKVVNGTKTQI